MMGLDAGFWVETIWKVLMLGLMLWAALRGKDAQLGKKIEKLEKDVVATNKEIAKLQTELKSRPSANDIKDIYKKLDHEVGAVHEKVNAIAKDVAKMSGTLESMETTQRMIHQDIIRGHQ